MFRYKIYLDTEGSIMDFINSVSKSRHLVYVTDGSGIRVSAKSMLGMLYAMTFAEMWCECDHDIYHLVKDFCAE